MCTIAGYRIAVIAASLARPSPDGGADGPGTRPRYEARLAAYHRAFAPELQAILDALPLGAGMRVLDFACGDGYYASRLARRLGASGMVVGVDHSEGYVDDASADAADAANAAFASPGATVVYARAAAGALPFADDTFDLVWCAQSLFSLPDPVEALRRMARVTRPGGLVVVLENDTVHQVCLPWPVQLELPVRAAELRSFAEGGHDAAKFYVGRRLPAIMAEAQLDPQRTTTHAFDRQAPIGDDERVLLQDYLDELVQRVRPFLDASLLAELSDLVNPASSHHLLAEPYLSLTWLNVLAVGRKPLAAKPADGARS